MPEELYLCLSLKLTLGLMAAEVFAKLQRLPAEKDESVLKEDGILTS